MLYHRFLKIRRFFLRGPRKCGGRDSERGALLVAVAVAVLAGALLMMGLVQTIRLDRVERREVATRTKMERIVYALSVYAQKNHRIPCPADPNLSVTTQPFGAERGSGSNGTLLGSCSTADQLVGIVPFKTLGLSEGDIKDEWGNYLTYRPSKSLANDTTVAATMSPPPKVHDYCRVQGVWVVTSGGGGHNDNNLNPQKAVYCCSLPEAGFDIRLSSESGTSLLNGGAGVPSGSGYQPVHTPAPLGSIHDPFLPESLGFVLISHGRNGYGSWLNDGTQNRTGNAVSAAELANANFAGTSSNAVFVDAPRVEIDPYYFDDIVIWRTQTALLSEVGNYAKKECDVSNPY